ncbi:MAG: hypothetical protein K1Y02_24865 [Candidatus Hydrogenedentes bacterium]|nr:hypothetical protein [Candidatus Hydrogenedentota bacterium]
MRIRIAWKGGELLGELNATNTAKAIAEALPYSAKAQVWGKEVYFSLPVDAHRAADAVDVVEPGTMCYWVQGRSLALPYGPTPASTGDECRLVTAVNIVGKIEGDPNELGRIRQGELVTVSRVEG